MSTSKKYELTDEVMVVDGHTLHRIRALRSFLEFRPGDLGGWVESEDNLSHDGDAWVYGDAKVYGMAWVYSSAKVSDDARICGNARVHGGAWVHGKARVYGHAEVCEAAEVCDDAQVCDWAQVYGKHRVSGSRRVDGNTWTCDTETAYAAARKHDIKIEPLISKQEWDKINLLISKQRKED